ncbi:hemicentin-1-like [Mytilus californianus]|uniref:hemicentin-1-like n=1 Tax=Mytilus californianus TaxID=6549 RepID=UPI002248492C|nr:hemicentin-1-like [Mytilus californianus]
MKADEWQFFFIEGCSLEPLGPCSTNCGSGSQLFNVSCDGYYISEVESSCGRSTGCQEVCSLEPRGPCSTNCGSGRQTFNLLCDGNNNYEFESSCESSTGCQGGWSEWVPFGECSTTCDEGQKVVKRRCDNPYPGRDSAYCDGDDVKYAYCNLGGCPGSWSCWEDDGHCSTSCGNGTQLRRRRCNNPTPTNGGENCPGDNQTNVHCNTKECPVYKWGHLKQLNITKDDLKDIMKDELNEMKSNLTIDSKNLSATIRKRISARDDRPSAASVGYVGVALLLIPLVMIISFDATKFFAIVANIYRKVCKRKSVKIGNGQLENNEQNVVF